jgi:DinB family protein
MTDPVVPPSDDKDWTWVLERSCPDCGFDATSIGPDDFGRLTRVNAAALLARLDAPDAGERSAPEVWSALEYACHVRDVCRVFGARLGLLRSSTDPLFANWDQDATALAERYWEQPVATVRAELGEEAERLAAEFDTVETAELNRPGRRSNGSVFTVDTVARYFLHDLVHHVHDVAPGTTATMT